MSKYIKPCHPLTHERSRMPASRTPESQWCTRSSPPTRLCLQIVAYAADTGSNLCLFAENRTPSRLDQRTRFADPCAQRATAYARECPTASCRGRGLLAPDAHCRHNLWKKRGNFLVQRPGESHDGIGRKKLACGNLPEPMQVGWPLHMVVPSDNVAFIDSQPKRA